MMIFHSSSPDFTAVFFRKRDMVLDDTVAIGIWKCVKNYLNLCQMSISAIMSHNLKFFSIAKRQLKKHGVLRAPCMSADWQTDEKCVDIENRVQCQKKCFKILVNVNDVFSIQINSSNIQCHLQTLWKVFSELLFKHMTLEQCWV